MTTETPPDLAARNGKRMRAAGMLAAGAIAGGIMAGTLTANADSSGSTGSAGTGATATTPGATAPSGMRPPAGGPCAGPVRTDESTPSSDVVAELTKKAKAEVAGGTVLRVETDAGDGAYEAHMQKADGTMVTVKFDKNLDVIGVEDGMGLGDPMPHHMGG